MQPEEGWWDDRLKCRQKETGRSGLGCSQREDGDDRLGCRQRYIPRVHIILAEWGGFAARLIWNIPDAQLKTNVFALAFKAKSTRLS